MKIAVVKSSDYQDLWVNHITSDSMELFKSSMMRCPPIGLAETGADFIIVNKSDEEPCKPNWYPVPEEYKNQIRSVSHSVDDIDWQKYSIVLCINTCVPNRIINQHPKILWCYWVGENNWDLMNNRVGSYDIILNQDVMKQNLPEFSIGFPYSYVGPYTMETIGKRILGVDSIKKQGIYMEINNTEERPVVKIPDEFLRLTDHLGIVVRVHSQDILENAIRIYKSKYFVKLLGRVIRGNGLLECISAGTLIIANRKLVILDSLVLPECHVESVKDICQKITYFEENPREYKRCVQEQRDILERDYFKGPFNKLLEKYNAKCLV